LPFDIRKSDRNGYNDHYKSRSNIGWSSLAKNNKEYIKRFKLQHLTPFAFYGMHLDGNVRGRAVERVFNHLIASKKNPNNIKILDAGSGLGGGYIHYTTSLSMKVFRMNLKGF
jgi:hypothetical protein